MFFIWPPLIFYIGILIFLNFRCLFSGRHSFFTSEFSFFSISDACSPAVAHFLHRNSHLSQFPMLVLWPPLFFLHRNSRFSPFSLLFLQLLLTFCIGNLNLLHLRCFFSGRRSFFTSKIIISYISDAFSPAAISKNVRNYIHIHRNSHSTFVAFSMSITSVSASDRVRRPSITGSVMNTSYNGLGSTFSAASSVRS